MENNTVPELENLNLSSVEYLFSDKINISDYKVAGEMVKGRLILELSELQAFKNKKNDTDIKDFMTTTFDRFRPTYDVNIKSYPRSAFIIGTTNEEYFLKAQDRRFIVFEVNRKLKTPFHLEFLKLDFWQFWAEIKHMAVSNPLTPIESAEFNQLIFDESKNYVNSDFEDRLRMNLIESCTAVLNDFISSQDLELIISRMPKIKTVGDKLLGKVMREIGFERNVQWNKDINRAVRGWKRIKEIDEAAFIK